jgi:hypothetical protein
MIMTAVTQTGSGTGIEDVESFMPNFGENRLTIAGNVETYYYKTAILSVTWHARETKN